MGEVLAFRKRAGSQGHADRVKLNQMRRRELVAFAKTGGPPLSAGIDSLREDGSFPPPIPDDCA